MNAQTYQEFTDQLYHNLEQRPSVVGLIALGSMAQQDYQPDQWSDHDFFVITVAGEQEALRLNLDWLPDYDKIVLSFRETAHGLKVLYKNGHLLEFAIFEQPEVSIIRLNRYRVLLDRADLTSQLESLRIQTANSVELYGQATIDNKNFGVFLCNLLVGVGRYRRGEKLSGQHFVKSYAFSQLLVLLERHLAAPDKKLLDNLDAFRRVERVFPELGAELLQILSTETEICAQQLLTLADRLLRDKLPDYPAQAVEVVTALF